MNKKYIIFCVILLVVATAGLTVWQNGAISPVSYTATSTATTTNFFDMEPIIPEAKVSTERWKTCRNEEYGWEVKYPAGWFVYSDGRGTVEGNCQTRIVQLANWNPNNDTFVETTESVTVRMGENLFGTARSEITNVRDLARSYDQLRIYGYYIVDNEESAWLVVDPAPGSLYQTATLKVVMYHNGTAYEINGSEKHIDQFETILSTFRFLDTATSSPK